MIVCVEFFVFVLFWDWGWLSSKEGQVLLFWDQALVISQWGQGCRVDGMHLDLYTLCVYGAHLTYYFYFQLCMNIKSWLQICENTFLFILTCVLAHRQ